MKPQFSWKLPVAGGVAIVIVIALAASAGNLNPPAGPVAPTMVTLDDLNSAIAGVGAGSCDPACQKAISGLGQAGAFLEITNPAQMSKVFDFSFQGTVPVSQCFPTGQSQLKPVTFTRDISCPESVELLNAFANNMNLPSVKIFLADSNNVTYMTYRMTNALIIDLTHTQVQRCDGTYQQLERVTLVYQMLELECTNHLALIECDTPPG